jgi:hypothetical protein
MVQINTIMSKFFLFVLKTNPKAAFTNMSIYKKQNLHIYKYKRMQDADPLSSGHTIIGLAGIGYRIPIAI